MPRATILEYLDNFQRHAREAAYVHHRGYRVQRWTYGEVLANAHRFARELDSRKIAKGDKVLIWGDNCAEWVVAFFGCLLRGDTAHYDVIVNEVARGIGQSAQETGVPHAFGVLTCENLEQAIDRAGLKMGNKGFEAALAAVEMANLKAVVSRQSSVVSKAVSSQLSAVRKAQKSKPNTRRAKRKGKP